ncbi:hypothetical protein GQ54DRAFT_79727 [Martensiomyces pterosporus]|nr:hypothetical protein GQ54DRAFT_79727 [Martensiomyces pterosporus]
MQAWPSESPTACLRPKERLQRQVRLGRAIAARDNLLFCLPIVDIPAFCLIHLCLCLSLYCFACLLAIYPPISPVLPFSSSAYSSLTNTAQQRRPHYLAFVGISSTERDSQTGFSLFWQRLKLEQREHAGHHYCPRLVHSSVAQKTSQRATRAFAANQSSKATLNRIIPHPNRKSRHTLYSILPSFAEQSTCLSSLFSRLLSLVSRLLPSLFISGSFVLLLFYA